MRFLVFKVSALIAAEQVHPLSRETATFYADDPRLAMTLVEIGWVDQNLGQEWDAEKLTSRAICIPTCLPDKTILLAKALNQMVILNSKLSNRLAEAAASWAAVHQSSA